MTKFIFIRHGQSVTNIENRFAGQCDTPLTEKGLAQADMLSDWIFKNYKVDKIYSSSLSRAYNTALPLANALGIEVIKTDGFKEIDTGLWHGKRYLDIKDEYPNEYHVWKNDMGNAALPNGETVADFANRISAEIKSLAAVHPDQTVVIATHAVAIRAMMSVFLKGDISAAKDVDWVPNASVTVANFENSAMTFELIGFDGFLGDSKSYIPSNII